MSAPELAVVMPVYNEEGAIEAVIRKWSRMLESLGIDFEIHAYNDGSADASAKILGELSRGEERLCVHNKENSGHGPTILGGYRECSDAEWIFQVDSDDEMAPESFVLLWQNRTAHDILLGERNRTDQPLARRLISGVSRATVRLCYGSRIHDVNAPYRLMRGALFAPIFVRIPDDTFAPNVAISGLASALGLRVFRIPVVQRPRQTGEVSIRHFKLLEAAARSFFQTIRLRNLVAELSKG
jgi:dolichol-phosphate mannosyltransferase